jgi:hypothetical protein
LLRRSQPCHTFTLSPPRPCTSCSAAPSRRAGTTRPGRPAYTGMNSVNRVELEGHVTQARHDLRKMRYSVEGVKRAGGPSWWRQRAPQQNILTLYPKNHVTLQNLIASVLHAMASGTFLLMFVERAICRWAVVGQLRRSGSWAAVGRHLEEEADRTQGGAHRVPGGGTSLSLFSLSPSC